MSGVVGSPPACPPWPKQQPDARTLRRFWLGRALHAYGATQALIDGGLFESQDYNGRAWVRYRGETLAMIHLHDSAVMMAALIEQDEALADRVAERCWTAAVAGDSYGEWLWEWGEASGLDPDAIQAEAAGSVGEPA